mmetsp:Transcript_21177/g.26200  ORF Transcript_21177/g.26200 Transcript_21177/m.26200 type:complete len:93 (-) Transcript_21177:29-307(-)
MRLFVFEGVDWRDDNRIVLLVLRVEDNFFICAPGMIKQCVIVGTNDITMTTKQHHRGTSKICGRCTRLKSCFVRWLPGLASASALIGNSMPL